MQPVASAAPTIANQRAVDVSLGVPAEASPSLPRLAFPPGHFYSPIVDPLALDRARTWGTTPDVRGIDFNDASHREILGGYFPTLYPDYDFPDLLPETADLAEFYSDNSQFAGLDPRALFVLMRAKRPQRVVEVGSGFSSLLIASVNRRWLNGCTEVTCIDPYPRPFLRHRIEGITRLIESPVQMVPLGVFESLECNDILFIDSSHVAKTGSDVNHLYFEVLPRLASGVLVHVHDIFLPHDYPPAWVIDENRSWNEQYLLRAMLQGGNTFEVVFGSAYACTRFPELVIAALACSEGGLSGGGSFWIRKR